MTTLIIGFAVLFMVFVAVCNAKCFYSFKKEQRIAAQRKPAETLKKAQDLYTKGDWAGAVSIIDAQRFFPDKEDLAEACRILGLSYYYLGIKGPETDKFANLKKSKEVFERTLSLTLDNKRKMSAMNGLPLVLWILGELKSFYHLEALKVSEQATQLFPDEPSVWNTRSIIMRWSGNDKESVDVCDQVYWTARAKGDWLTAGHGQQNRGDALKKLGNNADAIVAYRMSRTCYRKHEEISGKSATAHIESANKKMADLEAK